jgi:heme/copper-type cytochrome/quinol oxidase subunit 2
MRGKEMVTTASMSIILVMWMTVTWALTYMVMSHRRERQVSALEHYIYEQNRLIEELLWEDGVRDGYAEYEVRENGTWHRVQ